MKINLDKPKGAKPKGTTFRVPIYGVKVRVFEGDPGELARDLKFVFDEGDAPEPGQCDGAVFDHHTGCFTLVVNPDTPIGRVVAHEVFHLTTSIMQFVGVVSDESHAYLHGFLMDRVLKVLKRT